MPFSFFKMTAANKPTGAYSRPRTGSSYTSTKIYKTDERGRRVVAGTRVGTYDKRQDRIVYTYRPVVERPKPTMSNFLAKLFAPTIERKIEEESQRISKDLDIPYDPKTKTFTLSSSFLDFRQATDKVETERRLAFEKEKAKTLANIEKEKQRRAGLIGSEPEIETRINQFTLQKLPSSGTSLKSSQPSVFSGLLDFMAR
jgi:hypothetical protein